MQRVRAAGLAGQAIAFSEKTQEASRPLLRLKQELDKLGQDFADCSDQCDVVARLLDQASEAMLKLARQILQKGKYAGLDPSDPDQNPYGAVATEPDDGQSKK